MLEKLKEDVNKVNLEVKKLQQSFHYVLNDYDYHHENNEKTIIAQKKCILNDVEGWCTDLKENTETLTKLLETAKERTRFYEEQIKSIAKKHDIDISEFLAKDESEDVNKENEQEKEIRNADPKQI